MKLVKFERTIKRTVTGCVVLEDSEASTPMNLEYDICDWCEESLDEDCYDEDTTIHTSLYYDLGCPANSSWFRDEIFPNNKGSVLRRNEDGDLDNEVTKELLEEFLDKAKEDKEYSEFAAKQLKLL